MRILFVGDVFGHAGRRIVGEHLAPLIEQRQVDLVVVNAENAAGGLGVTPGIADELFEDLDAPVKRVAAMDTFVAYQPVLEDAILPQPEDLFRAIAELAKY